jgi:hypothetical protein
VSLVGTARVGVGKAVGLAVGVGKAVGLTPGVGVGTDGGFDSDVGFGFGVDGDVGFAVTVAGLVYIIKSALRETRQTMISSLRVIESPPAQV